MFSATRLVGYIMPSQLLNQYRPRQPAVREVGKDGSLNGLLSAFTSLGKWETSWPSHHPVPPLNRPSRNERMSKHKLKILPWRQVKLVTATAFINCVSNLTRHHHKLRQEFIINIRKLKVPRTIPVVIKGFRSWQNKTLNNVNPGPSSLDGPENNAEKWARRTNGRHPLKYVLSTRNPASTGIH